MSGSIFRIFQRAPVNGHDRYEAAMSSSSELIGRMRAINGPHDTVRALITDILAKGQNVPFVTSIFETVQELKSGTDQRPGDLPPLG